MDSLDRFSSILDKGELFYKFVFAFLQSNPHLEKVYSKRNWLSVKESRYFSVRVDFFFF